MHHAKAVWHTKDALPFCKPSCLDAFATRQHHTQNCLIGLLSVPSAEFLQDLQLPCKLLDNKLDIKKGHRAAIANVPVLWLLMRNLGTIAVTGY